MVKIANEVIKDNNYTNIIKVINKRSTELTVGPGTCTCIIIQFMYVMLICTLLCIRW